MVRRSVQTETPSEAVLRLVNVHRAFTDFRLQSWHEDGASGVRCQYVHAVQGLHSPPSKT